MSVLVASRTTDEGQEVFSVEIVSALSLDEAKAVVEKDCPETTLIGAILLDTSKVDIRAFEGILWMSTYSETGGYLEGILTQVLMLGRVSRDQFP